MALTERELADRIEIDDLLTRYATAIDEKDWKLLATVFTPDAHLDYSAVGGAKGAFPDVARWLEDTLAMFPMTQHLVTNRRVTLEGDTATGRSYFYNPMAMPQKGGGTKLFFCGGYYNDRFARTGDGWRIVERIEENAWFDGIDPPAPA